MDRIEIGDEIVVNGERLYVEGKAERKWYKPFSENFWHCYDGYGEDRLVKESDILGHFDAIEDI